MADLVRDKFQEMITDHHLRQWAFRQRKAYVTGELSLCQQKNLEAIPGWFWTAVNPSIEHKKQLLEIARKGEDRPNRKKQLLGVALCCYTNRGSSYDPEFDKLIRNLRLDWFDPVLDKKKQLLEIAEKGEDRPNQRKRLGAALCRYTNGKKCSYDPDFDKQLRDLRPDWFITSADKKRELLSIAEKGEDRPNKKHKLGAALSSYTCGSCYDPDFDKQLRELRPDWFVDKSAEKKKGLLNIARQGEDRPINLKLRQALYRYTIKTKKCYDPDFDKQIRTLRPDWFRKSRNDY